MKGFVLHFGSESKKLRLPDLGKSAESAKEKLRRYGVRAVFAGLFALGFLIGAGCASGIDKGVAERLDLLFVTNISARLSMSVPQIFLSCFVAYFLFIFCAFLMGLSAWGFLGIPLLSVFRGFTAGLSCALIYGLYKMTGVGFYILVILPGTLMFLFILVRYSAGGFHLSRRYMRLSLFGNEREPAPETHVKRYFKRTLFALLGCGGCAAADMILWLIFANKFDF